MSMQQQTQRKFFPQEEIAMGHREELLSTLSSTGLPYLFMLLSSLYQSTSANICCLFPICKCMLNKAIYSSWSQGSPSINLSLIVCSGCNCPCISQRPTFKLETKFLWTNNNDTSKLPDCSARQSYLKRFLHTCSCTEQERMRDHQSPKLLQPPIF